MRLDHAHHHDNSLAGILTRLTHGIIHDANERAEEDSAHADASADTSASQSWLDRLDNWFWKQELEDREAFLARSTDVFDLEQRMRKLEHGRN